MKAKLIYFLGNDGSGKTTVSKALLDRLTEKGIRAHAFWWLEGEKTILRKALRMTYNGGMEKHDGKSERGSCTEGGRHTGNIKAFYPYLVLIDSYLHGIRTLLKGRRSEILIADRYVYDVVQALSLEFDFSKEKRKRFLRMMMNILPVPEIIFLISVPPEVAFERKKEDYGTMDEARHNWENAFQLIADIKSIRDLQVKEIDNSREIDAAISMIFDETAKIMIG